MSNVRFQPFTLSGDKQAIADFISENNILLIGRVDPNEDMTMFPYMRINIMEVDKLYATWVMQKEPLNSAFAKPDTYNHFELPADFDLAQNEIYEWLHGTDISKMHQKILKLESEVKRQKQETVIMLKTLQTMINLMISINE